VAVVVDLAVVGLTPVVDSHALVLELQVRRCPGEGVVVPLVEGAPVGDLSLLAGQIGFDWWNTEWIEMHSQGIEHHLHVDAGTNFAALLHIGGNDIAGHNKLWILPTATSTYQLNV
jgi:hypothetical protein